MTNKVSASPTIFNELNKWNQKFDIWSFFSDFFFLFGVLFLGWNPVLLILWLMIDTAVMLFFVTILFHQERKDWMETIFFIFMSPIFLGILAALYIGLQDFIIDLNMEKIVNADPTQLFNSILLPIILSFSALNHYSEYKEDRNRMLNGTYKSSFIKHFFLRYVILIILITVMVFFFVYFQIGILLLLLVAKAVLRIFNKKMRTVL